MTRKALAIAILVIGFLSSSSSISYAEERSSGPWGQFRGPAGNGIPPIAGEGPTKFDKETATWRTELPGQGWSSPIVVGDSVLVTAAVPKEDASEDFQLSLIWIDLKTGEIVRTVPVLQQNSETAPAIHQKNSHASPTPVALDGKIFAHFGHQGSVAVTPQGDSVWTNRELVFPPVHGNGGSPVVVGDRLVFTCDGAESPYVAALDCETGKVLWKTERPVDAPRKFSFCTPTVIEVDGQTQVICPGSDCVLALNPDNGEILWQVLYDGYSVVPKPVYADGLVFVVTGFGPTKVLAIDPRGAGDVTESHVVWSLDRGAPKTPSLLAHKGILYVLSDDGVFTAVETKTGEAVYKKRLGGNYSASPLLVGDQIYLTSEQGVVTVIRAGEEFEVLSENDLGERSLASPAFVDGHLLIRTADALYRFDR